MKKIQIMVDGLRDRIPQKNCGDCVHHKSLFEECWESYENWEGEFPDKMLLHGSIIVCDGVEVIRRDLHKTEEEDNAETYERFKENS